MATCPMIVVRPPYNNVSKKIWRAEKYERTTDETDQSWLALMGSSNSFTWFLRQRQERCSTVYPRIIALWPAGTVMFRLVPLFQHSTTCALRVKWHFVNTNAMVAIFLSPVKPCSDLRNLNYTYFFLCTVFFFNVIYAICTKILLYCTYFT
jgi:hypothetical protein